MVSSYAKLHSIIGFTLLGVSLVAALVLKPAVSAEFSGQTELLLSLPEPVTVQTFETNLASLPYAVSIERDRSEYTLTTEYLNDEQYLAFIAGLEEGVGEHTILSYQSFSPSISSELIRKSFVALIIASLIIVLFISFAFRGVSRPIASYKYGVVSIVALLHDVSIPLGLFTVIALYTDAMIDTLFVTAVLATLGYSINDTIVIFDRIRERLRINEEKKRTENFSSVVDHGVRNSIRRSIYTSLSTAIPLVLLFLFVPVTKWFAAALLFGVIAGTYSSIFFAPSLLVLWHTYFPQTTHKKEQVSQIEEAENKLREALQKSDTI